MCQYCSSEESFTKLGDKVEKETELEQWYKPIEMVVVTKKVLGTVKTNGLQYSLKNPWKIRTKQEPLIGGSGFQTSTPAKIPISNIC